MRGDAGAGQRHMQVVLTNGGSRPCYLSGYGGLGLAAAGGGRLPTRQVRVPSPSPHQVTLAPGAAASSMLSWAVVPGGGSGDCLAAPGSLRVTPPDQVDGLALPWSYGPVCEGGTLRQNAYTAAV